MPGWSIRVNPVSLIFLAFAMSTDAFAAAIGKGSSLDRPRLSEALRTGIIFGVIEAPTPWRSFPGHHIFFTPACYAAGLPWGVACRHPLTARWSTFLATCHGQRIQPDW